MPLGRLDEYRQLEFLNAEPLKDEWCLWFSGFVDGEGYFCLPKKGTPYFGMMLSIVDIDVLNEIKSIMQVGHVNTQSFEKQRTGEWTHKRANARDCCTYDVCRIAHLWRYIVPFFEQYPLRTRKRGDFEIWREAVRLKWKVNGGRIPTWAKQRYKELSKELAEYRSRE